MTGRRRATRTGETDSIAFCVDCQWTDERRGSLGRAAQHHDRTGHEVRVSVTRVVVYGGDRREPTEDQGALL